mmetsp:Transcript_12567/g.36629  ORF Transcript_12567/g.36629 Transcript_12567/m.36629 type:complete len:249 (+) Transcript_12567:1420-2166(+)
MPVQPQSTVQPWRSSSVLITKWDRKPTQKALTPTRKVHAKRMILALRVARRCLVRRLSERVLLNGFWIQLKREWPPISSKLWVSSDSASGWNCTVDLCVRKLGRTLLHSLSLSLGRVIMLGMSGSAEAMLARSPKTVTPMLLHWLCRPSHWPRDRCPPSLETSLPWWLAPACFSCPSWDPMAPKLPTVRPRTQTGLQASSIFTSSSAVSKTSPPSSSAKSSTSLLDSEPSYGASTAQLAIACSSTSTE